MKWARYWLRRGSTTTELNMLGNFQLQSKVQVFNNTKASYINPPMRSWVLPRQALVHLSQSGSRLTEFHKKDARLFKIE